MNTMHLNAVTFHDAKSADWEALYQRPSFQLRRAVIMGMLAGHLGPDARWLDAGCGSGYFSRELATQGCRVTGVDAAQGMVNDSAARAEAKGLSDRTSFRLVGSIEHLPFDDASFDGVLCSSVIEYVPDAGQALGEIARVLRPGGLALMTVPNRGALTRWVERIVFAVTRRISSNPWPRYLRHSRWHFTPESFASALSSVGLDVKQTDFFGPARPGWINRHCRTGMMLAALAVKR